MPPPVAGPATAVVLADGDTDGAGRELDPGQALGSHLTQPEAQFVYNIEVLGMPAVAAANAAQMPIGMIPKPHIKQAREQMRRELRGYIGVTKEDVVFGILEAIGRARIINEPATEIRGFEVVSKMLGYDAPTKIDVSVTETITVIREQMRVLPDADLVRMAGAGNVIDADFYPVQKK